MQQIHVDASGRDNATVAHKPRLLSENGLSYVATDLVKYLDDNGMDRVHGAAYHTPTQSKIKRWPQIMKIRVLLENYFLLGDLEQRIGTFVNHYNNHRYHESLTNLTPVDIYRGRNAKVLKM